MTPDSIRPRLDGGLHLHPRLFDLLVDLTDEDSRPLADVFWFIDPAHPPELRAGIAREWLGEAVRRGWISAADPTYPVTVAARSEDIDSWLVRDGTAYARGSLPYADVRCPELAGTELLRELLEAGTLQPDPGLG